MEKDLPIPEKFQHLRPQTIDVLRKRNFHDPHDDQFRAIAPPIRTDLGYRYDSIAFAFKDVAEGAATFRGDKDAGARDFFYSRVGRNLPPIEELRSELIALELGEHASILKAHYDAVLTPSGMSAIFLLCLQFKGKMRTIIASPRLYGGSYQLIKQKLPDLGIKTVMTKDPLDLKEWKRVLKKHSDAGLVFIEDDANPKPVKLPTQEIARLVHQHKNMLLAVDTTIGTPYLRQPHIEPVPHHESNADFTVHSLSKNIGGHSEDLGGAIVGRRELMDRFNDKDLGWSPPTGIGVMSGKTAEYFLRGARSLNKRMTVKVENARYVVSFLRSHPRVKAVYHSGSDLLAFEVEGGIAEAAKVVEALTFIPIAPHLGDIRTMAIHPASTTHSPMPPKDRLKHGITDNLIRISIGMEHPEDIVDDLRQALD
ncbi:PLP-dependent transferase [Candidatus Peregrinibacteria bacterium]|nr:PLP-dependent transferase [Candidatus Peregrinibacteria bacterium]